MRDLYGEGYWERAEGSNYVAYADDPGWDVILSVMQEAIPAPARIIEVACAKGYFVYHAISHGYEALGLDISEYAVSHGVARDNTMVHNAADPFPWGEADVVCSWEFFEHVPEDEVDTVLDNKIAALVPGGELWMKIGIVIPEDHPFAGQADNDHTHFTVRDRAWWEDKFRSRGLLHLPEREQALDWAFRDRDWQGRFFVWRWS